MKTIIDIVSCVLFILGIAILGGALNDPIHPFHDDDDYERPGGFPRW